MNAPADNAIPDDARDADARDVDARDPVGMTSYAVVHGGEGERLYVPRKSAAADPNAGDDAGGSGGAGAGAEESDGTYTGGKAGAGIFQKLIRLMPPHTRYIAGFAGHDAIFRFKKSAKENILVDADERVIEWWKRYLRRKPVPAGVEVQLVVADALEYLPNVHMLGAIDAGTLLYLDPEYLANSRSQGGRRRRDTCYRKPFQTLAKHKALLRLAKSLAQTCRVMISGYPTELYRVELEDAGWNVIPYIARTHGKSREERVWFNFPPAAVGGEIHDTRYVGKDFRDRTRIKRKVGRWAKRFAAMDPLERQVIAEALAQVMRTAAASTHAGDDADTRSNDDDDAGFPRTVL